MLAIVYPGKTFNGWRRCAFGRIGQPGLSLKTYRKMTLAPVVKAVLVRDFNKVTFGRWDKTFTDDKTPHHFESCDWSLSRGRPGPMPAYRWYVKHRPCHWLLLGIKLPRDRIVLLTDANNPAK